MHGFVDRSSVEVFVEGGRAVAAELPFPTAPFDRVHFYPQGGDTEIPETVFYSLESIWR